MLLRSSDRDAECIILWSGVEMNLRRNFVVGDWHGEDSFVYVTERVTRGRSTYVDQEEERARNPRVRGMIVGMLLTHESAYSFEELSARAFAR